MCKHDKIAGVLLAAGAGSRLGGGKLLLPYEGMPLIAHVLTSISKASFLSSLTIVLGYESQILLPVIKQTIDKERREGRWLDFFPTQCVCNPHWTEGMSTSLQVGVQSDFVQQHKKSLKGVMFLLADQPLLSYSTIDTLAKSHIESMQHKNLYLATVPLYNGHRGTPVTISPELIPEVLAEKGDVGARNIIKKFANNVLMVTVEDVGVLHDVDTHEAYNRLCALEHKTKANAEYLLKK